MTRKALPPQKEPEDSEQKNLNGQPVLKAVIEVALIFIAD